jgi:tRNA(fMet)-specific endonuclease VapC
MLQFLLDTDHLTLLEHGHPPLRQHLAAQPPGAVGLTIVTVEESLRGRLAAIARAPDGAARVSRYGYLLDTLQLFQQFPVAPFDQAAENHFQQLRSLRLRIGTQDLKIAAVVLAHNLTLLTRNHRDFGQIPGLLLADWSL